MGTSASILAINRLQMVRLMVVKNIGELLFASLQQLWMNEGRSATCSTTSEATIASKPEDGSVENVKSAV
jgi:hypothetical protein